MSEQDLNDAGGSSLLDQVRGEGVTQSAGRNGLGDASTACGELDGTLDGREADRAGRVVLVGKEEIGRMTGTPPLSEQVQRDGREGYVAILPSFALTDREEHPVGVDVSDAKSADLAQA